MRVMLHAVMIAAAAAQHVSPLPGGWTGVVDRGSHCWIAIPPRWRIDDGTDRTTPVATSPDGQATAMLRWTSASDFVGRMKVLLGPAIVVHEDSGQRFWIEYARKLTGAHHLVATPAAAGYCTVYIDVGGEPDSALASTINDIVKTIGPAR